MQSSEVLCDQVQTLVRSLQPLLKTNFVLIQFTELELFKKGIITSVEFILWETIGCLQT